MEEIRIWYNSKRDYAAGVALYLRYGTDEKLKRLFSENIQSDFKEKKLLEAHSALLSSSPHIKKTVPVIKPAVQLAPKVRQRPIENDWLPIEKRSDVEQSLFCTWEKAFAEMRHLQSIIGDIAIAGKTDPNKEQEAGRMALRILELDEECDRVYEQRLQLRETGKIMEEVPAVEIAIDPALWHKKLDNHQRYVRRFKKALEKDPTNTATALLIEKHEWAVNEYKRLLKMD